MNKVDKMGKPIDIGDTVVFGLGQTFTLSKAKVLKLTDKSVIVDRKSGNYSFAKNIQRPFNDVVVVEKANDN
mgnify:CR=1 FL=1